MTSFEYPTNLLRSAERPDAQGLERGASVRLGNWMEELPSVVRELCQHWGLALGSPYQPGGVASWVAPARTATGERAVLKVAWLHDEARHEVEGLQAWNGNGAVRVIDTLAVRAGTAGILLEACDPGTPLSADLPPLEQDEVAAGLLRRLWIEPPEGAPFRPLSEMCAWWADEGEQKHARAEPRRLDPGVVRAGFELFRTLPTTAERSVLLCTDLHPGNILAAQREPWLVIDPKPYVGDPTYDPLQYMLNFPERLIQDAEGFLQRMADLLDLDRMRLRQWLFARCVEFQLYEPDMADVAVRLGSDLG